MKSRTEVLAGFLRNQASLADRPPPGIVQLNNEEANACADALERADAYQRALNRIEDLCTQPTDPRDGNALTDKVARIAKNTLEGREIENAPLASKEQGQIDLAWQTFLTNSTVDRTPWEAFVAAWHARAAVETTNEYPTDKAGWICSVCHGWNHVQHKFCTHTHAVGPEVKTAPDTHGLILIRKVDAVVAVGESISMKILAAENGVARICFTVPKDTRVEDVPPRPRDAPLWAGDGPGQPVTMTKYQHTEAGVCGTHGSYINVGSSGCPKCVAVMLAHFGEHGPQNNDGVTPLLEAALSADPANYKRAELTPDAKVPSDPQCTKSDWCNLPDGHREDCDDCLPF